MNDQEKIKEALDEIENTPILVDKCDLIRKLPKEIRISTYMKKDSEFTQFMSIIRMNDRDDDHLVSGNSWSNDRPIIIGVHHYHGTN